MNSSNIIVSIYGAIVATLMAIIKLFEYYQTRNGAFKIVYRQTFSEEKGEDGNLIIIHPVLLFLIVNLSKHKRYIVDHDYFFSNGRLLDLHWYISQDRHIITRYLDNEMKNIQFPKQLEPLEPLRIELKMKRDFFNVFPPPKFFRIIFFDSTGKKYKSKKIKLINILVKSFKEADCLLPVRKNARDNTYLLDPKTGQ